MSSTQQLLLGEGAGGSAPVYIEDVFSTYLYTGNGSTQTITNGIDLSGKGGLMWGQARSNAYGSFLVDSARGINKFLTAYETREQQTDANIVTAFNSNGFSLGPGGGVSSNTNGTTYVSWTFREQPKFFDVVTYTGDGANRTVAHNLGSVPGCIIVKRTDTNGFAWQVYHRSLANTQYLVLNTTAAVATGTTRWNSTTPTSTVFSLGTEATVNASGGTYVAYIFAHDAGGFGLTGTDNVISCGSYTSDGSGLATINLGYEPQWVMVKGSSAVTNWQIVDNMRGFVVGAANANSKYLNANSSAAELDTPPYGLTNTGFTYNSAPSTTFIYIAIRRGPMKVPTAGTSVYSPLIISGTSGATNTTGFPIDLQMLANRAGSVLNFVTSDRLRGVSSNSTETGNFLVTSATSAESGAYLVTEGWNNTAYLTPSIFAGTAYMTWNFRRAPSFFDEVCYTGTGSARTVTHNLTVAPELILVKYRDSLAYNWSVYSASQGATKYAYLNATDAFATNIVFWNNTSPTSSVFSVGSFGGVNASGGTYVAYLFATCAGVSKVGSYTGTGALQTVNCGFTSGSRFVMIKRTDSTGDWYVYDSVRGITAGNDPYIFANDGSVEVTGTNYVDTDTTGFKVTAAAPAGLNASGGTYIFLAIA